MKDGEEMCQLKDSISEFGILYLLIVRPRLQGVYKIISGQRKKYRICFKKIGYTKFPVNIRVMTDEEWVQEVKISCSKT